MSYWQTITLNFTMKQQCSPAREADFVGKQCKNWQGFQYFKSPSIKIIYFSLSTITRERLYLFRNHIFFLCCPNTTHKYSKSVISVNHKNWEVSSVVILNYGESLLYLSPPLVCLIQDLISIILARNYFEIWVLLKNRNRWSGLLIK